MNVCLLRYFNPVGAHPSGTPHRPPTLDYQAEPCEGEGEGEGEAGRSPPTPDKQAGSRAGPCSATPRVRASPRTGRIGEDPKGIPNNLMPFIQQVSGT